MAKFDRIGKVAVWTLIGAGLGTILGLPFYHDPDEGKVVYIDMRQSVSYDLYYPPSDVPAGVFIAFLSGTRTLIAFIVTGAASGFTLALFSLGRKRWAYIVEDREPSL